MSPEDDRAEFDAIMARSDVATERAIRRLDERLNAQPDKRVTHTHRWSGGTWLAVGVIVFATIVAILLIPVR